MCVSRGRHLAGEPHEQMRITQTCSRERKEEKGKHESEEKKLEEQKGLVVGKQNEENKKKLEKRYTEKEGDHQKGEKRNRAMEMEKTQERMTHVKEREIKSCHSIGKASIIITAF